MSIATPDGVRQDLEAARRRSLLGRIATRHARFYARQDKGSRLLSTQGGRLTSVGKSWYEQGRSPHRPG